MEKLGSLTSWSGLSMSRKRFINLAWAWEADGFDDFTESSQTDRVHFRFDEPSYLGSQVARDSPLLQLRDVSFRYESAEGSRTEWVIDHLDMSVALHSRICLLGPNGQGKSTVLKLLAGKESPVRGERISSGKATIGYFSQHAASIAAFYQDDDALALEEREDITGLLQQQQRPQWVRGHREAVTPLLYMQSKFRGVRDEVLRGQLGLFGLKGQMALTPVERLSGGQRARLILSALSYSNPHILLLDEPTNHLDATSIAALAEALSTFKGAVVFVSHDQWFVSQVMGGNRTDDSDDDTANPDDNDETPLQCELWVAKGRGRVQCSFRGASKDAHAALQVYVSQVLSALPT